LVGQNCGTIEQCFSTVKVTGSSCYLGGLVGANEEHATITDCYARGNVSGSDFIGGLVGLNVGSVTNSYSTGAINSGGSQIGGLIGSCQRANGSGNGSITNLYYDTTTSGMTDTGKGTGTSSSDMKAENSMTVYTGWDTNIWDWSTESTLEHLSSYPYLKWQNSFAVLYYAGGAVNGSVPFDPSLYATNSTSTVKSNYGSLINMQSGISYELLNWNTLSDGKGDGYRPGVSMLTMGMANVDLYATWMKPTVGTYLFSNNGQDSRTSGSNIASGSVAYGTDRSGRSNAALSFNEASLAITTSGDYLRTFTENSSYSISMWIYLNELPASGLSMYLITLNQVSTNGYGFHITVSATGHLSFISTVSNNGSAFNTIKSGVSPGAWHHIVCVYNGTGMSLGTNVNPSMDLYLDGISIGNRATSTSFVPNTAGSGALTFNDIGKESSCSMDGLIDDVRIYNTTLSAAEVSLLYHELKY
jgi:hypothetical protein